MIVDVSDRQAKFKGRVKLINVKDNIYDVDRADEPTETGSIINRNLLMGMQGFTPCETTFNADGSITEVGTTGTKVTVFEANGDITETFTNKRNMSISKTTKFNADGSISEVIN